VAQFSLAIVPPGLGTSSTAFEDETQPLGTVDYVEGTLFTMASNNSQSFADVGVNGGPAHNVVLRNPDNAHADVEFDCIIS